MTEYEAFHVRTLAEIEHLGGMIETIMNNPLRFELTPEMILQHRAALHILYWVRCNPDIEDMTAIFEADLRARGFEPPNPIKAN